MRAVAEPFIRRRAVRHLEKGRVVVFAAGTGNPYFTTDTAAALRAMEMKADVILKGTKVDGIYTADPMTRSRRPRSTTTSPTCRCSSAGLKVMDATAISLCMDNKLPIVVFNLRTPRQPAPRHHGRAGRHDRQGLTAAVVHMESTCRWTSVISRACSPKSRSGWTAQIEHVRRELGGVRTGRASVTILDTVHVEAYGSQMPLNQVASLSIPEPHDDRRAAVRSVADGARSRRRSAPPTSA